MSTPKQRGFFIVLEGIDRVGKTTQAAMLNIALSDDFAYWSVRPMRFPVYDTPVGQVIADYLKSKRDLDVRAAHLLFCANRWEKAAEIEATLAAGNIIVCDRYSASGIAYSAAKGAPFEWCVEVEKGLPQPDCVIHLVAPVDTVAARANFGVDDRHEVIALQHSVAANYDKLSGPRWHQVDASLPVEEVAQKIHKIVMMCHQAQRFQKTIIFAPGEQMPMILYTGKVNPIPKHPAVVATTTTTTTTTTDDDDVPDLVADESMASVAAATAAAAAPSESGWRTKLTCHEDGWIRSELEKKY